MKIVGIISLVESAAKQDLSCDCDACDSGCDNCDAMDSGDCYDTSCDCYD